MSAASFSPRSPQLLRRLLGRAPRPARAGAAAAPPRRGRSSRAASPAPAPGTPSGRAPTSDSFEEVSAFSLGLRRPYGLSALLAHGRVGPARGHGQRSRRGGARRPRRRARGGRAGRRAGWRPASGRGRPARGRRGRSPARGSGRAGAGRRGARGGGGRRRRRACRGPRRRPAAARLRRHSQGFWSRLRGGRRVSSVSAQVGSAPARWSRAGKHPARAAVAGSPVLRLQRLGAEELERRRRGRRGRPPSSKPMSFCETAEHRRAGASICVCSSSCALARGLQLLVDGLPLVLAARRPRRRSRGRAGRPRRRGSRPASRRSSRRSTHRRRGCPARFAIVSVFRTRACSTRSSGRWR